MTKPPATTLAAVALALLCWATPAAAQGQTVDVRSHAATLLNSPHQVTLGNPSGDVTVVEFFDYNCGYCKRALDDKLSLIKHDTRLRLVLKELPVLGRGSVEAAQVAIAVRMQDRDGSKYLAFHERLMRQRGPANRAAAIEAARAAGLDVARIERDIDGDEVRTTLEEGRALARAIGVRGTPTYIVGERMLAGAVGAGPLQDAIKLARTR